MLAFINILSWGNLRPFKIETVQFQSSCSCFFLKKERKRCIISHTKWTQRDFSWNNVYPSLKHIGKSTKDKSEWKLSIQSCKPPFIEAWGWCLGVSQVEPDSLLTSLLLALPFAASLEETAASHKKLFTAHRRSANTPLPGSPPSPIWLYLSCQKALKLQVSQIARGCFTCGLNVGQRVLGLAGAAWSEQSGYLQ